MQAILLAAGESSRFYPFNQIHKSSFELMGISIIQRTIESLYKNRKIVKQIILVVSDSFNSSILEIIEKYPKNYIKVVIQKSPEGMGEALLLCNDLIKEDFVLLHAHHVEIEDLLNQYMENKSDYVVLVKEVEDCSGYGRVELREDRIVEITEKPVDGGRGLVVSGVYFLPKSFLGVVDSVKKHHYSFEDALSLIAKKKGLDFIKTDLNITLKYPWDLFNISEYLFIKSKTKISKKTKLDKSVIIKGDSIIIEDGVVIEENVVIKGPCYIGKDSYIGNNSVIRNNTVLGEGVKIGANMEIKNSIISGGTTTHSGFIGDSVVGSNVKIAANFITGNARLDRQSIHVQAKDKKINTNRNKFGAVIGNQVNIGINSSIMPGVVIGNKCLIGPSTIVYKNLTDNTKYYSKIIGVVERKLDE